MKGNIKPRFRTFWLLLMATIVFNNCSSDPELWDPQSEFQVLTDYVNSHEEYSEFAALLEATELSGLFSVRGPYTLFLPNNDAFTDFYAEKGVSSFTQFSPEYNQSLVLNHLVNIPLETGDIGLGALRDVNGIGDFIVTEFSGADIILNKKSKIIDRNIRASNGVVHIIDKVIEPVDETVFEILEGLPGYSIFAQGLEATGIKDTLNLVEFPFGSKMARTRFTILAVADTTYNRYGINSFNDLVAEYTDEPGQITDFNNGFYRYMEYHCLVNTYYLNNFENNTLYPILSFDNNISMNIDTEDYKINLDRVTDEYTGFIMEASNYPAKNGAVHTVNTTLPVYTPAPTVIVWETTDHFDLKQGDYYGSHYVRWHDGLNTFQDVKWEGDYLLYYFKDHNTGKLMNHDCLSMSGWGWIEVKTPKIMKGKYQITSNLWGGQLDYAVYVDGVNTANILRSDPAESTSWGEFDWETTSRHTIKVVAKTPGLIFWDTLIFTPIN